MNIKVRVFLSSLLLITFQVVSSSLPASAVEFGEVAIGDPNVVKVGGSSGFLYSERIVLTVAHVIDGGGSNYWESYG